jgi:hypothetical protein
MLRRILGPKREEVVGVLRRLLNAELQKLHASPNIARVIKSRRMRWGHAARMEQMANASGSGPCIHCNEPSGSIKVENFLSS